MERRALLASATLAACTAVFFWRILSTEDPKAYGFPSADLFLYYYPVYEQTYARLRAGIVPTWNPWQLCGTPWLAALQAGFYYPGHLLYLVFPTHVGMALSGALHLLIAAAGTYAFMRGVGLGHLGALTAGLVFAHRGSMPNLLNGPNLQEAAAWIGVGALGTIMLATKPTARAAALLAAATGMSLLAGYPQHTVYLLYTWVTLWLAWTIATRPPPRAVAVSGLWFGLAVAVGVLVSAAQLVPTIEVVLVASRGISGLPDEAMAPLGNFAENVLRRLPVSGTPFSFGVVPLVLVALASLHARLRALAWWALGLGVVAAIFALGTTTDWFWVYRALPGIAMFRGPDRLLVLVDFAAAVAAGIGLDALVRGGLRDRGPAALVIGGVPTLVAAWVALGHARQGTPDALPVLAGIVVAAAWCGLAVGRKAAGLAGAIVLGGLAIEIFLRTNLPLVYPYTAARVRWFESFDAAYGALASPDRHDRTWVLRALDPPLAVKHATRHHFRSLEDYESVNLRRQNEYLTFLGEGRVTDFVDGFPFIGSVPHGVRPAADGSSPGTRRRLLDLAGVARIAMPVSATRRPQTQQFLSSAGLTEVRSGIPLTVVSNPNAVPRAYVVHRTAPAPPPAELLPLLAAPGFDPLVLAYVEGDPGFTPAPAAPARGQAARFVEDGEQVVEVEATATTPALLVLADTYFTGWQATVDGAPAPILPTNHLFRGVPIPAGVHRVRFTYEPWTVPAGQAVSALGIAALAALVAIKRRS